MRTADVGVAHPPPGFIPDVKPGPRPNPVNGSIFLFHIPSDPTESINLADSPQHQDKLSELLHLYRHYQIQAKPDLVLRWGFADPNGDPALRDDKAWGPFNKSHAMFKNSGSNCAYANEEDGIDANTATNDLKLHSSKPSLPSWKFIDVLQ